MIQGIVDRFEGNIAVVEIDGKEMKDFPKKTLPKGVKVGDMLIFDGDTITISREGTEKLRKEIEDLMDELFED
ncbi:DUF3006 domain-containing protein [Peribacillus psychrosaccharolyticus]|uniref:DUF3006 domain-containing protein n=1 Tax=Peribacillus psychrosaccharolyticus TaxID=1407 RepID=A0A974NMM6_PERPY|nr:DUF3006 domain-containing protein [Peribacillus psychrosaccharolyticus]MEC2056099.1 DUF3006 domain-containing protein [Peribacillus psychrosaccharolyticus]MED3745540.1 DUF3006 domain-containing protein [Peribacillus psychrosaccharolyticus]QQT00707.1 DUF3006 domain-containing protein [Peribacillus psychrosaccharolyticus]